MAARAVLEIRQAGTWLGDGMRQHQEDEHDCGAFDYWGLWTDRHPETYWAGIRWSEHPEGVSIADLPPSIDDPVPLILPDGQLVVPPDDVPSEVWAPVLGALLDIYREGPYVGALLYGHA